MTGKDRHRLVRRQLLAGLGASGVCVTASRLAALAGPLFAGSAIPASQATSIPRCVVSPEQTEGPFYVDTGLMRSDIRSDPVTGIVSAGQRLDLELRVLRVDGGGASCAPLPDALVDVWHCDATGTYSDVDGYFGRSSTSDRKFLRGCQSTDASGTVRFTTIFPGWYAGRCVHVHLKVRVSPAATRGHEFTSQLYFDDAFTDRVHARAPYAARRDARRRNEQDGIFRRDGAALTVDVRESDGVCYGRFDLGLLLA